MKLLVWLLLWSVSCALVRDSGNVKAGSDINFNGHLIKFKASGAGATFRAVQVGIVLIPVTESPRMRDRESNISLSRHDTSYSFGSRVLVRFMCAPELSAWCERTNQGRASSCQKSEVPAKTAAVDQRSIVLEGDFKQIVGADTTKFLEECTRKLSSDGRDVKCVAVRPGSIVVDIRGSTDALDAAVSEVKNAGLKLPSFSKLSFSKLLLAETTKMDTGNSGSFGVCFDHAEALGVQSY